MSSGNNEIWGLCVFNKSEKAASCADDGTLRIWDLNKHKQLHAVQLDIDIKGKKMAPDAKSKSINDGGKGRCVSLSPRDDFAMVGMMDGSVRLYQTSDWKLLAIKQVAKRWIEDIKFSPDGKYVAIGAHDSMCYILHAKDAGLYAKLDKSSAAVIHLDWSEDSQWLRVNDLGFDLIYYDIPSKKMMTGGASATCNELWSTATCPLTWGTLGIWQPG